MSLCHQSVEATMSESDWVTCRSKCMFLQVAASSRLTQQSRNWRLISSVRQSLILLHVCWLWTQFSVKTNDRSKTIFVVLFFSGRNSFIRSSLRRVDCWDDKLEKKGHKKRALKMSLIPSVPHPPSPDAVHTNCSRHTHTVLLFIPLVVLPTLPLLASQSCHNPLSLPHHYHIQANTHTHKTHTCHLFPLWSTPPPLWHLRRRKVWLFMLEGYLYCKHRHSARGSDTSVWNELSVQI